MSDITIRNINVFADQETLIFREISDVTPLLEFRGADVGVLLDFIRICCRDALNRRVSFRVPTSESCGLKAVARWDEGSQSATPRNLSLGGILVELPTLEGPAPGTQSEMELSFEETTLVIPCVCCRQDGRVYAFEFTSLPQQKTNTPLRDLARIVMEIQRRRLSSRSTMQVG